MAKKSVSTTFEHATINLNDMTITEELKEDINVYNLMDVLRDWDGIENISIVLKHGTVLPPAFAEAGD